VSRLPRSSAWKPRPIPVAVAGCLWLFLAATFFLPAVVFVAIQSGPLWLLSVVAIPAIPLTLFALVVSKPTPNRLGASLAVGILVMLLGAILALPRSAESSASGGQALLLVGLGVVLSSGLALRSD
jgi:hypothetical protein